MDFLSAKRKKKRKKKKEKTPEGKLWVTFHMVKYGGGWGAWRWRMGGGGLHLRRRWKEKLLRGETKGEEYSKAEGGSKVK